MPASFISPTPRIGEASDRRGAKRRGSDRRDPGRPDRAAAGAARWLRHAGCLLALALGFGATPAFAQTCTALAPVVNPTFAGTIAPWTTTTAQGASGWTLGGSGVFHNNDMGTNLGAYNSIQQTIAGGVAGGSEITIATQWGNGGGVQGVNGNQVDMQVVYNNVVYATFRTSPFGATPAVAPAPTASNGATLTQVSAASWTSVNTTVTYRIRLPANMLSAGGVLRIQTSREQNATSDGATDDLFVRNVSIASPSICLVKQTNRQAGNQTFSFTTANADTVVGTAAVDTSASITTTAANTPVAFDAWTVAGTQPLLVINRDAVATIQETTIPTGYRVTAIACTGFATAPVVDLNTGTVTVAADSFATPLPATPPTCTYTNSRPRVRLQKALPNGRIDASDQFALNIAGPSGGAATNAGVNTAGTGAAATGTADFASADAGGNYVLTEAMAADSASALGNYTSQIACSNANAGSPTVLPNGAGISFDLANLAPADDITCTYSNGRTIADLTITKSNTFTQAQPSDLPDDVVATGAATTYTLAVTNQGPAVVTGAVVRDAPGAGITCPGGNTVTITGNGVPPGSFTINDLIAGIALGQLAAGETARLSFTCTVN